MTKAANLEQEINAFLAQSEIVYHGNGMLSRMQYLMDALKNPEKNLRIIHVAGTSGKTSTSYFAASLLQAAGYTTGLTVSPHIDSVRERAIVNLAPLSEADWVAHMSKFFAEVKSTAVKPSFFEFYMAFALWLFKKLELDYVVVETGLGGRWDASNVATRPDKICILTDIGLDHTEILGADLRTIAAEKAGIIHAGNTVFMYPQNDEVITSVKARESIYSFNLHIIPENSKNFMTRNFNLAKTAVSFAIRSDHHAPLMRQQITRARSIIVPARAEEIHFKNHQIIMDGSHNPQKLQAFATYLAQRYSAKTRTLIATLGNNKTATLEDSMKILRQISEQIILTSFSSDSLETHKRTSIDQQTLVAAAKKSDFKAPIYINDPRQALEVALQNTPHQIVITGSFYLLNHIRPYLFDNSAD